MLLLCGAGRLLPFAAPALLLRAEGAHVGLFKFGV